MDCDWPEHLLCSGHRDGGAGVKEDLVNQGCKSGGGREDHCGVVVVFKDGGRREIMVD